MKIGFVWEDLKNPKLNKLREQYQLEKVVNSGQDEFKKQLLLKEWIFNKLPYGFKNRGDYKSADEVLSDINGNKFNCTWYVLTYLQCAQALGWQTRKLGIDTDHGFGVEEMRHTVVDIWSSQFNRWYVIDPMFNVHFEKDEVPLNSYEIRKSYIEKDKIDKIFGNYSNEQIKREFKERNDKPENYFWFFILLRNNYMENPNVYDSRSLLWVDEYNKNKTWYVGGEGKGEFRKHPQYQGAFIETNDYNLCYPKLNEN